ncbi:ComEC/Rec2 family competence protein [Planktothrix sp. FACHB-1365]|uniref:ComEC/Rec2 family competence protein n=1 Tax=Planktothrix sp. FACHB-1365 TaxID=2692855 RepID=UPI00168A2C0A|nr:ComEC/Rec2 family competence protein [Planktothrix sp. FACHB-1365]MBD2485201.1 ComEC/Rec2 family competence protein [Planktothrix sp. FACHB-1365]
MNQTVIFILAFAYLLGLLVGAIPWVNYGILGLGIILALATALKQVYQQKQSRKARIQQFIKQKETRKDALTDPIEFAAKIPKPPRPKLPFWVWLLAGITAFLASVYLQIRTPQPATNDISQLILNSGNSQDLLITVRGEVGSIPRLTRSGRGQFWLNVNQVNEITNNNTPIAVSRDVKGLVYVTVPLLKATGLYPGESVAITGSLYQPQPPSNPGGFDFYNYLAQQGSFAGLRGRYISHDDSQPPPWGLWKIRQRITRAQAKLLGVPEGSLLSAMVLGRLAVDLPYDIRDTFVQVGLAHILAASGFQVSFLLGVILALTQRFSPQIRFILGLLTLLFYLGLTGISPSVLRATLMGLAVLIALLTQRQTKPLNVLLLVAILLLIVNPLWISDIGFQLSFLATLGLMVTVPPLMQRLNWMPPFFASLIAVPLAVMIWTLPLQLYIFKVLSPYSILVNIIASPLISIITLGGMASALVALFMPGFGSAISQVLHYPILGLIETADYFSHLPGNSIAVGSISLIQLITLYSLNLLIWGYFIWVNPQENPKILTSKKGWIPLLFAVTCAILIVVAPGWYTKTTQFQATILGTPKEPILVIEEKGKVTLINSGSQNTAQFVVLPFLNAQGVNEIQGSVATHPQLGLSIGWPFILENVPIKRFYDNPAPKKTYQATNDVILKALAQQKGAYVPLILRQPVMLGSVKLELLNPQPPIIRFEMGQNIWTLLGETSINDQKQLMESQSLTPTQVLWWSGEPLSPEILSVFKPKIAIASSNSIDPKTVQILSQQQTQIFWTGRDGAIRWTPTQGFETTLDFDETDGSLL